MMYPKFFRPKKQRVVAGVASGLAVHFDVDVLTVRLTLLVSCLFGGLGLLFYMLTWMMTKPATVEQEVPVPDNTSTSRIVNIGFIVLGVGAAAVSFSVLTGFEGASLVPVLIVGVGALVVWRAYDQGVESLAQPRNAFSIIIGVGLVLAGVLFVTINWVDPAVFGATFAAVLFTMAGAALLAVPLLVRMWQRLVEERDAKAASTERAEIAARLHDSVLQTLALIQKRADDPAEVARLARGQERELRQWLFEGTASSTSTVAKALELAAGEVEDLYGIRIAPVTVGDTPITDETQAAVLAAREAMVNAAKHARVSSVDVYAEVFGQLEIFVRDRGVGFNPDEIDPDRHGVRDSIVGRVKRVGGESEIKSALGEGTEVHIKMPLDSKV